MYSGRSGVQVDRVRRSTGRSGAQVDRVRRSTGRSGVQVPGVLRSRHVKVAKLRRTIGDRCITQR